MSDLTKLLSGYFEEKLKTIGCDYNWPIPKSLVAITNPNCSSYRNTINIKEHLGNKWKEAKSDDVRLEVAYAIVRDWGQIKRNRPETMIRHVNLAKSLNSSDESILPIKGVASYSKILSAIDTRKYAIYDARVAACLNAVQYNLTENKEVSGLIAFNYIPGRNNTTGNPSTRTGFTDQERFKVRSLVKRGWTKISRAETYTCYLETLKSCQDALKEKTIEAPLYDLEMILFSHAENECRKAMNLGS